MGEGHARRARPALRLARGEPDQVPRLLAFRVAHPQVIIGAGEFGVWQAVIPRPNGEIVVARYELRAALHDADDLRRSTSCGLTRAMPTSKAKWTWVSTSPGSSAAALGEILIPGTHLPGGIA